MFDLRRPVVSLLACSLVCTLAGTLACGPKEGDANKAEAAKKAEPEKTDVADAGEAKAEAEAGADANPAEGGAGDTTGGETETETGEELPPPPSTFEKVGVEVCDQYVTDYVACIDAKVPEDERDAQRRHVDENVSAWKQMASGGPSAEKGLQTACRIAREQAKRVTADWGCEW